MATNSPAKDIVNVMKWMYQRGLIQVRGGNASIIDRSRGTITISPSGVPRPLLEESMIAEINLDGETLQGTPSSEWRMHVEIYRRQPQASAIVHAHPRSLIAATHRGLTLDPKILSEAGLQITCIARVPYIRPGTWDLAKTVGEAAANGCNVIVLENHGVAVWSSKTIYHALDILEAVEDLAWIVLHQP